MTKRKSKSTVQPEPQGLIFGGRQSMPARQMAELIALAAKSRGYLRFAQEIREIGISFTGIADPFPESDDASVPKR